MTPSVHTFGKTDRGRHRPHNEDAYDIIAPAEAQQPMLLIVADGMGGTVAGEVASALAVSRITTAFQEASGNALPDRLAAAVRAANAAIYQVALTTKRQGMGSTVVCAVLDGQRLVSAHVGDSRLYRLRGGAIERLTHDHSLVQARVDSGLISEEEAERSTSRNIITRVLGVDPDVEVDVAEFPVEEGDRYLLCTDGLSGLVRDPELRTIIGTQAAEEACERLIALANERGGPDNITAVIAAVGEPGSLPAADGTLDGAPGQPPLAVAPAAVFEPWPEAPPEPSAYVTTVLPSLRPLAGPPAAAAPTVAAPTRRRPSRTLWIAVAIAVAAAAVLIALLIYFGVW